MKYHVTMYYFIFLFIMSLSLLSLLFTSRHLTIAHESTTGSNTCHRLVGGQCTYVKGYNDADPVEEQHEHIVSWSPVERT